MTAIQTTLPAADLRDDSADGWTIFIAGLLMAFGVAMVYSASVNVESGPLNLREWWRTPLRQGAYALGGFIAMLVAAGVDHRFWSWSGKFGWIKPGALAALAIGLLAAVLIVGSTSLGARRAFFIPIAGTSISFQPSEFAKVAMVVWLAALLGRPGRDNRSLRSFLPAIGSAGLMIGLTGKEDFGTAALMGVVMFAMLIMAGVRWRYLLAVGLLGVVAGAVLIALEPYRIARLRAFVSDTPDPSREGYQVTQAMIAIASGGWFGRGLGNGVQKHGYIPHDDNDFIFAVICEELGIVGGIVVIALFLLFLLRGYLISRRASDSFGALLAGGLTLIICLQAAFNIAVVTNTVPTKGISLPFISAGGSGVLFLGVSAGLIASVGRRDGNARASGGGASRA